MSNILQVCKFFVDNKKTKFAIKIADELADCASEMIHYYTVGLAYKELGEYSKAINYFVKCLSLCPPYDLAQYLYLHTGMCYADQMQTEKGLEYLYKCDNSMNIKDTIEFIERRDREIKHIAKTGYWTDHSHHLHSLNLANYIAKLLDPKKNVYDFGCGTGFYLGELEKNGFKKCTGFEGSPPQQPACKKILEQDITKPITIKTKGSVICLEVAEHVPAKLAGKLFANIEAACNDWLVMSWAVRGQMGIGHVNCKNNDESIEFVEGYGFVFDQQKTDEARSIVTDGCDWFQKSLLIFKKA